MQRRVAHLREGYGGLETNMPRPIGERGLRVFVPSICLAYNARVNHGDGTLPAENARLPESLDEIVSHHAVVLADQIQKAAAWAKSEMDLQVEVAGALMEFARRA